MGYIMKRCQQALGAYIKNWTTQWVLSLDLSSRQTWGKPYDKLM